LYPFDWALYFQLIMIVSILVNSLHLVVHSFSLSPLR
jgi:hypothetical protein